MLSVFYFYLICFPQWHDFILFLIYFHILFVFLFWPPSGIWSSLTRDQIQAVLVTWVAAAAMPDPLTHCARLELNLCLSAPERLLIPLTHSGNSYSTIFYFNFILRFVCLFVFLGLHLWHTEVPRLGVKLELQLLAYTTTTAMHDPSRICNLHHSSQQCQTLNPLNKARDRTHILMDTSQVHYRWTTMGRTLV